MALIPNYSSAYNIISSMNSVQYYHIDEPIERETYNPTTLRTVAGMISALNPNGKMLMSSYKWPTWWFEFPFDTYGDMYKYVLNYETNSYIICDDYYGNYFGSVSDYWQKFRSYYGSGKNITEWMHLTRNSVPSGTGNSFSDLFDKADYLGINSLWLYANGISTESRIFNFCKSSFYSEWLRAFARDVEIIYRCSYPDPCDCDPDEPDGWYVDEINYVSGLYEIYP